MPSTTPNAEGACWLIRPAPPSRQQAVREVRRVPDGCLDLVLLIHDDQPLPGCLRTLTLLRAPTLHQPCPTARLLLLDVRDAADLADLLRMHRLPEAYIATPQERELRELVRHRAKLVALRSGLKAQVHATLAKQGRPPAASDVLARPPQWLVGFTTVSAAAGDEVTGTVVVPARAFHHCDDTTHAWHIEPRHFPPTRRPVLRQPPLLTAIDLPPTGRGHADIPRVAWSAATVLSAIRLADRRGHARNHHAAVLPTCGAERRRHRPATRTQRGISL